VNDVTDNADKCPQCGYTRFPIGVSLKSDRTGREIAVRLGATFGQANLRILNDEDIKYASRQQFKLEKRREQGGWAVLNIPLATHPTFLNGAPVDAAGAILKEGDKLSIKGQFFHMSVRILMS